MSHSKSSKSHFTKSSETIPSKDSLLDHYKLYEEIIDKFNDELLLISSEGRIVYCNEVAARGLGLTKKALLHKTIRTFYKKRLSLKQWQETYFLPLKKRKKFRYYEIQRVIKGGAVQTIGVTAVYLRHRSQDYILSVGRDISERVNIRSRLEESEDRYRLISEGAADGIFAVDLMGRLTYANLTLEQLTGYTLQEAKGLSFKNFLTIDSLPKAMRCFQMAKEGHLRILEELNIKAKDGKIIPVEVNVSPLMKDEKIIGVHAIIRDNRRHKQLENLLKESEKKYRDLFEDATDALILADVKGHIREVNRQAENLLGVSRSQLIGSFLSEFYPKEQNKAYQDLFLQSLKGKSRSCDLDIIRKNGDIIPVAVFGCMVKINGAQIILVRFCELTERIRHEEKIRESNMMEALNLFFSGTAQEIEQPLRITLSQIERLLKKYQKRDFEYIGFKEFKEIMSTLHNLRNQIGHCYDIAYNLLAMTKRRAVLKKKVCQVNDVLNSSVKKLSQELKVNDIRVVLKLGKNIPLVAIGAVELEEVATCILENSRQAMLVGGKITMKTSVNRTEGVVMVEFKDEGIGMPKEILSRVFEPFFTTKQRGLGHSAGLGLSRVYFIIKESRGDISIKSNLRQGTIVKLSIPIYKTPSQSKRSK